MTKKKDRIFMKDDRMLITLDGVTKPLREWASHVVPHDRLRSRGRTYLSQKPDQRRSVRDIVKKAAMSSAGRQVSNPVVLRKREQDSQVTTVAGLFSPRLSI